MTTNAEHWEHEAESWTAWVRGSTPDAYGDFADAFFALLPPPGGGRVLEIGCGEGRVCRDLVARGYAMTAIDVAPTMVRRAREADSATTYLVADAAALPFEAAAFELVVAYNSLMDVDELDASVREAARVLVPGGHFAACVLHPLAFAGAFTAREADAPFVIDGSYLQPRLYESAVPRNGHTMRFRSWAYPLEAYAAALSTAGLMIDALREPALPDEAVTRDPADRRWQRIPEFLFFRAVKPR